MKLSELLNNIEAEKINVNTDIEVSGIAYDSRKVEPGFIFVAIKGFKKDGHEFIAQSLERGAIAVIAEEERENTPFIKVKNSRLALALISAEWYKHPSSGFKLIGVTGTNGKTTSTYLIKGILEKAGHKVGLIGTNQIIIGDKVLDAERTTPESLELQKLFSYMRDNGADFVVMEVSSHALSLHRVDGCEFDVGIFTNLTQDHLDFHKTMEEYKKAKTRLFTMCKTGIINLDDDSAPYILKNSTSHNITYSLDKNEANVAAKNVKLRPNGVEFEVLYGDVLERMELAIPGEFSVYNALCAISCTLVLDININTIAAALKKIKGVKGRAEVVNTGTDFTVIIDYAHTPDGLYNILSAVSGFAKGRIVSVFGCGGDRDKSKRPKMGRIAGGMSDVCVVTSDNPRTENPRAIIDDILEGMTETAAKKVVIENRREAIAWAIHNAKPDDVVVLAGKGHETYQILKDKTIHFDEREVVNKILEENRR